MSCLYLDSSAVLRFVYRQAGYIDLPQRSELAIASPLTGIKCLRSLDRLRLARTPGALEPRLTTLRAILGRLQEVELSRAVLIRAAAPMPAPLGSLDAIHLASALFWREVHDEGLIFATHDRELGQAARMHGMQVLGL